MKRYLVTLVECGLDEETIFVCDADDEEHAVEQAENAYPGCGIVEWKSFLASPRPWIICPTCQGEGKHSRNLGSFTREDIERDWDPDEWQDYLDGAYDTPCHTCFGLGRVRDDEEAWKRHKDQLNYERGVNDAGEPLW